MMKNYKKFWWVGLIMIKNYEKIMWNFIKYKFTIGLFEFINFIFKKILILKY